MERRMGVWVVSKDGGNDFIVEYKKKSVRTFLTIYF